MKHQLIPVTILALLNMKDLSTTYRKYTKLGTAQVGAQLRFRRKLLKYTKGHYCGNCIKFTVAENTRKDTYKTRKPLSPTGNILKFEKKTTENFFLRKSHSAEKSASSSLFSSSKHS